MRSGSAWLLGLAFAAGANALTLEKRESPAVFTVPMTRGEKIPRQFNKRSKTLFTSLQNEQDEYTSYVANITFGTPPQNFLAYIETGSNRCWLGSVDSTGCMLYTDPSYCGGYGGYNQSASTTAKALDEKFSYDDYGDLTTGDMVTDVLALNETKVENMKMGVNYDITGNTIGLGYGNSSSISLTQALADAGAINSPAFSLWDQTLLFGGVNKARYNGSLYTFPIVNGSGLEKSFRINMTGISINETAVASSEFPLDAAIEIGLHMSYVPKSVAQALNAHLGEVSAPDESGQVNFSCSAVGENATIEFKFGELELQFSLWYFISQDSESQFGAWDSQEKTCYFKVSENVDMQKSGSIVLGANFISLVYAVFDLENDEVSLAKALTYPYGLYVQDDIVEITRGANGIPGAVKESAGPLIRKSLVLDIMATAFFLLTISL